MPKTIVFSLLDNTKIILINLFTN